METITLTIGEQSENHFGMEKNGEGLREEGYSLADLLRFQKEFRKRGYVAKIYGLHLRGKNLPEAHLLVVKKGAGAFVDIDKMFKEQLGLKWDTKYWDSRRSKVLNKNARWNLCYGSKSSDPDYEKGKGRIVGYDEIPITKRYLQEMEKILQPDFELQMEGNYYYDNTKCGIGPHGDAERKITVGLRLGATIPLKFCWYERSKTISDPITFHLEHGDIYIMDEKATGFDWKCSSKKTLRHCAGAEKYTTFKN